MTPSTNYGGGLIEEQAAAIKPKFYECGLRLAWNLFKKSIGERVMKCIDALSKEHKIILRALDIVDHMASQTEKNQPVEPADVETILRFLRVCVDNHHQTKEESALFPELMRTAGATEGP